MSLLHTILGHQPILDALRRDRETGNVSHAYLLDGPAHIGKFTVAKWFAMELLSSGADPQGKEHVQHEVDRLMHPDLLVVDQLWIEEQCEDFDVIGKTSNVQQEHRKKAKAKTDTISIDDVREIQKRLHDVGGGTFRCCLIRSVERMQPEAVNALLKILEEPPQGLVFMLTTQSLSSLLPTLLSRTRILRLGRLRDDEMEPLLKSTGDDERLFLLHLAQGAPGVIKRLLANPEELRSEKTLHAQAISFWHSRSLSERLKLLAPLHDKGPAADRFALHLALALREEVLQSRPQSAEPFLQMVRGMESNVSRQLLAQQLAMALE